MQPWSHEALSQRRLLLCLKLTTEGVVNFTLDFAQFGPGIFFNLKCFYFLVPKTTFALSNQSQMERGGGSPR